MVNADHNVWFSLPEIGNLVIQNSEIKKNNGASDLSLCLNISNKILDSENKKLFFKASISSFFVPVINIIAPALINNSAIAFPIPLVPPVINATLPFKLIETSGISLFVFGIDRNSSFLIASLQIND